MENHFPKGITEVVHFLSVLLPGSLTEAGFLYNITLLCEHGRFPHHMCPASHSSSPPPIMWYTPTKNFWYPSWVAMSSGRAHSCAGCWQPGTGLCPGNRVKASMKNVRREELRQGKKAKRGRETSLLFSPHLANSWSQLGGENWAKLVSLTWSRKFQESHISPFRCTGPGPAGCLLEATYMELFKGQHELHLLSNIALHLTFPLWSLLQERRGPKRTLFQYKHALWEKQPRLFINSLRGGPCIEHTRLEHQLHAWHCVRHWPSSVISCSPCPEEKGNSDANLHASWITRITGWQSSIEKGYVILVQKTKRCF